MKKATTTSVGFGLGSGLGSLDLLPPADFRIDGRVQKSNRPPQRGADRPLQRGAGGSAATKCWLSGRVPQREGDEEARVVELPQTAIASAPRLFSRGHLASAIGAAGSRPHSPFFTFLAMASTARYSFDRLNGYFGYARAKPSATINFPKSLPSSNRR
jgi:hypothetical protein